MVPLLVSRLRALTRAGLVTLLTAILASTAMASQPDLREQMREVFANMRVLLALSAEGPENLANPANEDTVIVASAALAERASAISEHAARDEASFLADALERYAIQIRRSYNWGLHETTSALVLDTVEVCVACHTRLPSRRDSQLGTAFLAGQELSTLDPLVRARLQIATRAFEDAIGTLESVLPAASNDAIDDVLRIYLLVALRVKEADARARRTIEMLAEREDLPRWRRRSLLEGADALRELRASAPAPGDLAAARRLVNRGVSREASSSVAALVDHAAASRLLYEFLDTAPDDLDAAAEAYYLLGVAQHELDPDTWLPQAELHLEKAVRTAPDSDHATRAYELLEQQTQARLAGANGKLPVEAQQHLDMLRGMLRR